MAETEKLRVVCPHCQKRLVLTSRLAGKRIRCPNPKCGKAVYIAIPSDPPPERANKALPTSSRPAPSTVASSPNQCGDKYTEQGVTLSAVSGQFSKENLTVRYKLSPNGKRVFHSGGILSFLGNVDLLTTKGPKFLYWLDGKGFDAHGGGFDPDSFTFSPDSLHYAYTVNKNKRWQAYLDNEPTGDSYDEIRDVGFSPKGRLVYAARLGKQWMVVQDGRAGAAFDGIEPHSLASTLETDMLIYKARRGRRRLIVCNGEEADWDEESGGVCSPDGRRRAVVNKSGAGFRVVIDGEAQSTYDKIRNSSVCFSADGAHYAYVARQNGKWRVVLDGKEGPEYDRIALGSLSFSPKGGRFAYTAGFGPWWRPWSGGWKAVIDGEEGPMYLMVEPVVFSLDGSRTAYAAFKGNWATEGAYVVDGTPLTPVRGAGKLLSGFMFSDDGRHYAYVANGDHVIADGKVGKKYKSVALAGFLEGGRVVYLAQGEKYRDVGGGLFGPPKNEGDFFVVNDYESEVWVSSPPPTQFRREAHNLAKWQIDSPRSLYAVSYIVNQNQVSFFRNEITLEPAS